MTSMTLSTTAFPWTWPSLAAFALASLVLSVTPGPGVLYIVTRTLAQGRRAGLASIAGVALGNLGNAVGASLGLAALFSVSSAAFTVVKVAGAGYLAWLGLKALRAVPPAQAAPTPEAPRLRRIFRDGLVVALLNPKTALFFAAFLPQFIDPRGSAMGQSLALGVGFVAIAASTDTVYVLAAGAAQPALARVGAGRGWGRYLTGGAYLGLAAFTLLFGTRAAPKA
jgi:threonine/homoserine/homoserine lactone efflux protein